MCPIYSLNINHEERASSNLRVKSWDWYALVACLWSEEIHNWISWADFFCFPLSHVLRSSVAQRTLALGTDEELFYLQCWQLLCLTVKEKERKLDGSGEWSLSWSYGNISCKKCRSFFPILTQSAIISVREGKKCSLEPSDRLYKVMHFSCLYLHFLVWALALNEEQESVPWKTFVTQPSDLGTSKLSGDTYSAMTRFQHKGT